MPYFQIATVSPGMNCCEHSLNTLRYAHRYVMLDYNHEFELVCFGVRSYTVLHFELRNFITRH